MSAPTGSYAVGVVLAAGLGTRVGADGNKAYLPLAGRSMVAWSLNAVTEASQIARSVLVYRRGERELARDTVTAELPGATVELVEGGGTRHASEFNVLRYLADDIESGAVDVVLIHDAARPLAGGDMFVTALSVAREFGGAIPALTIADVVQQGPEGIGSTRQRQVGAGANPAGVSRATAAARVPGRRRGRIRGHRHLVMHREVHRSEQVRTFPGDGGNLKVTYAHDVAVAARLLNRRLGEDPYAGTR